MGQVYLCDNEELLGIELQTQYSMGNMRNSRYMTRGIKVALIGLLLVTIVIDSFSYQSEKEIILINIDSSGHEELALLIKKVDYFKPKVLALDLTFDYTENVYSDVALMKAIWNSKNPQLSVVYGLC